MKKVFVFIAVLGVVFATASVFAQDGATENNLNTELVEETDMNVVASAPLQPTSVDTVESNSGNVAVSADKSAMEKLIGFCLEHLNYGTVTLFMAIESSFIPFPSEAVVPPAAWKAATSDDMNVVLVVIFATLGALIGALINYYIAVWLGRPIIY